MGERHVEDLYSAAYDGELSEAERRRYDAHVGGCERCAAGYEEFRAAVDAVRGLPAARMPVRVVLPTTPPVAEGRSWWAAGLSRLRVPVLSPGTGGAALALAGIAAVFLVVHTHQGGTTGAGSVAGRPALAPGALTQLHSVAGSGPMSSLADLTSCPKPLAVTSAQPGALSGGNPAGFANRAVVGNEQRPGEQLILATTSSHYTPGQQILVFAALTTSGGKHTVVIPCVALQPAVMYGAAAPALVPKSASVGATGGGANGNYAGAGSSAPGGPAQDRAATNSYDYFLGGVPLAIALPTAQSVAGTLPVQVLTIPADTVRGSTLRLVAIVPTGVPAASDTPTLEAVLTIEVS